MRRGLTTLELLVALAITSITGIGVAMVITSVSRGVSIMNDTRAAMQRAAASHVRLRAYSDTALCLLEHDARGFALWVHDERSNGQVNVSELRIFWNATDEGEIRTEFVRFPETMDDEALALADIVVSSSEDPFEAMLTQRSLGFTEQTVLADGVDDVAVAHETADPRDAERFRVVVGFAGAGEGVRELLMALGLPEHRRPE
jgi:type II secretory pathway pseudopilin PulG